MSCSQPFLFDAKVLVEKLKTGSAVSFPTDTLPALAACPEFAEQIWRLKKRSLAKPLILMGSSPEELFEWVEKVALDDAWEMARNFWPGALTLVLPAKGLIVDALNPGAMTLGFRVPAHSAALDLLSNSGPLATTSANLSGSAPLLTAEEVSKCFKGLPVKHLLLS